jgi:ribosomal protein L32
MMPEITKGWSPMPEDEAISWCRKWDLEKDVSRFGKWTPHIEGASDEIATPLGTAVELVWEQIKTLRPPCLTGDGHPVMWFTSNPIADPSPNHDPAETDRSAVVEHNVSVHNPLLPNVIENVDYSQQTEVLHTDPTDKIALDLGQVKDYSTDLFARLIFAKLDFRFPQNAQVCGGSWIHEARELERRQRCPKCGEFGSGYGQIRNERRFFHERNRSCYVGVVENRLKRNPLVKCSKCGEMGREHHGKDGHMRIRHSDRTCYIG